MSPRHDKRLKQSTLSSGTELAQVRSLVAQATQRLGHIDIVVNNAGIIQVGPMSKTTVEDFANALDVMFWRTLYLTLAVLPQMWAQRSGHVVNITSIGSMVSIPHLLPYTYAKFATVGLSEDPWTELGQEGIPLTTEAGSCQSLWWSPC